jgi:hypothetical protein
MLRLPRRQSTAAAPKSGWRFPRLGELDPDGCRAFLRRAYAKPAEAAADLGESVRTVEKWFDGTSLPGFRGTLKLILAHGPDFIRAVAKPPPAWLSPEDVAAERARLDGAIADVIRRLQRVPRIARTPVLALAAPEAAR